MDVRDAKVAALETIRKLLVVDAQAAQNRGVEVVNVDRIFDDIVAVIVGPAIADTGFDSSTGHPNRVAAPMMIAAVIVLFNFALAIDRAPEFAAPDYQRVIQQTALL